MIRDFFSSSAKAEDRQIFAIGDVHGCVSELEQLIKKLKVDRDSLVVLLGDYVDRGPDSKRVIDSILELGTRCETIALMGNHEAMFLDFLERPESVGSGLFILNGGGSTLANYSETGSGAYHLPETHLEFLRNLKIYHQTEKYFFVHAGVPLRKPLSQLDPETDREVFLWTRGPFLTTDEKWEKIIVHGHTPNEMPERRPNRVNCDTGCVFGGSLTAYDTHSQNFISVPKKANRKEVEVLQRQYDGKRVAVRFNGRMPVTAGRPGERRVEFETLNYNQFGLLLFEKSGGISPHFQVNDYIEGSIGDDHRTAVEFLGQVVRVESRQGFVVFGVKIDQISTGTDQLQPSWIKRPA